MIIFSILHIHISRGHLVRTMYYNGSHNLHGPQYHPGNLPHAATNGEGIAPEDINDRRNHLPPHPSSTDIAEVEQICRTMSRSGPAEQLHPLQQGSRSASLDSMDTDQSSIAQIDLDKFLKAENAQRESRGVPLRRLGVRFKGVTTWGVAAEEAEGVKTFAEALKRTLLGRDLYEWWIQPWFRKGRMDKVAKRALIRDVNGLVRDGEMML